MSCFIFESNIAHYQELLARETDARKIATVHKLLAEAAGTYAEWCAKNPDAKKE